VEHGERRSRLEQLYTEHAPAVHAYARRRTDAASAEDVVMEVFVIACRRLDQVPERPLPWLLGCARRTLANQRRGARRAAALLERLAHAQRPAGIGVQGGDAVATALARLRPGDREVLLLSAWEGLEAAEIAAVVGCSRTAAAVRLHRARRRLAAALEPAAPHPGDVRHEAEVT